MFVTTNQIDTDIPLPSNTKRFPRWLLVILSLLAFLLVLFLLEGFLRLVGLRNPVRYEQVVSPDLFAHDDTLGWVLRPNIGGRHISHEFSVWYTINSAGQRIVPNSAPYGHPTVWCLGESMTFGHGLNDEDTFPNRLAVISDARVWNLGVQAYGTDQSLLQMRRLLRKSRPDVVILSYIPSLIERNASLPKWTDKLKSSNRSKPKFRWANQHLELAEIPGSVASKTLKNTQITVTSPNSIAGFFLRVGNGYVIKASCIINCESGFGI
jgi:hypothetical protein